MDKTDKNNSKKPIFRIEYDPPEDKGDTIKVLGLVALVIVGLILFYAFEAWVKSLF